LEPSVLAKTPNESIAAPSEPSAAAASSVAAPELRTNLEPPPSTSSLWCKSGYLKQKLM
jgi:hypothetical protein